MGLLSLIEEDAWFKLSLSQNPFFIDERSELFRELITTLRDYSSLCTDNSFWEIESYEKRKNAYNELKIKKKKMNKLLNNLIPKGATNKKGNPTTRKLRMVPEVLVHYVETRKQDLPILVKKYKKKYKRMDRPQLIKKILEYESKIKNSNKIDIDERTYTTIIISILAYHMEVSFDTLYKIYHSVNKEKRKDIVNNPKKYFQFPSQT